MDLLENCQVYPGHIPGKFVYFALAPVASLKGHGPTNTLTQDILVFLNLNLYHLEQTACHVINEAKKRLCFTNSGWVTALELLRAAPFIDNRLQHFDRQSRAYCDHPTQLCRAPHGKQKYLVLHTLSIIHQFTKQTNNSTLFLLPFRSGEGGDNAESVFM